ncbi:MAG: hypothetical protein LBK76_10320 [Verrucomicrobiales bacterium]|nr:hypothetical protein [Verrucomicrobiales bacterium]
MLKRLFCVLTGLAPMWSLSAVERQAAPSAATGLTVKYEMSRDASVSLGLFDQQGRLLRYLQQAEFVRKGAAAVTWDGLDQYGEPLPVGNYVVKGVWYGPVTLEHDATVNNPGTPPWPTADDHGDWLADESSPQAAVSDGDWVYLGAPCCEDGFSIVAVDAEGQRQWGFKSHYCPRSVALAVDDQYLYVLYSGPGFAEGTKIRRYDGENAVGRTILYCFDKKTGRMAQFSKHRPGLILTTWPYQDTHYFWWDLIRDKNFSAATNGGQPRYSCGDVSESTNSLGIAALKGKLYIGYYYDGKVVEYDAETAEPTGLEIPVAAVVGLHAYDDHTLLAVSEQQVVKIDLARKVVESFIVSDLVAPMYATSDKAGNVFVSDWKDAFQVKQFDKSGKFVKAIGTPGGRPWLGKWDAQGMLLPRGVAIDGKNQLWVAEDDSTPRRVSVWDSVSGKLVRDYIGPASYGGGGYSWLDPQDRAQAVSNATRFTVDYTNKTGTPSAIVYRKLDLLDCFVPNGADTSRPARVLYHGKDEFFFTPNDRNTQYVLMKREGDVYRQAAAFGVHNWEKHLVGDGTGKPQWDSDIGYHAYLGYYPDFFKDHFGDWFAWQDADGDRRTQVGEMTWRKAATGKYDEGGLPRLESGWGGDLDREFTAYFGVRYQDAHAIVRLPVKSWTVSGTPVYDLADAKPIIKLDRAYSINGVYVTRDDKIMVTYSHEQLKMKDSIACFDKHTGQQLWAIAMPVAERQKGHNVHGTGVTYDYEVPGLGVVCATWSWHGAVKTYLFTTSGDYLDAPLTDNTSAGPFSAWGESFRSGAQYGDDKYLLNGGSGALHVLKIKGLGQDEVGRFELPYKIDNAMAQQAEAFRNLPKPRVTPSPIVRMVWKKTPPVIDGQLDDWTPGEYARLDQGDGRKAEIALARDQANLYIAARVYQATPPLRNGGNDWQRLFLTGDCVDLMLRTDAKTDARTISAVPGDERLLLSIFEDRPVAVLYQPVVSGSDKAPVQMLATSIDRVTRLASANIRAERGSGHYVIEAAIPLADLHIDPKNYDALPGDVGVIFADGSGRNRALRLYYYNHSLATGIVNDLTTEATLQPGEWGKIQLPLGPNLLADGGFEAAAFAAADTDGWITHGNDNGASVTISGSVAYSGRQSAYFHVDEPLDIPDEAYFKATNGYAEFLGAARGGQNTKGRIHAGIHQRIPVIGGHKYSARISYLSYELKEESHRNDERRGLAKFNAGIRWQIPPPNRKELYANLGGAGGQNYDQWHTVLDYGSWFISQPFVAPDDATEAIVTFDLDIRTGKLKSEAYLDNVEFVDITERDQE